MTLIRRDLSPDDSLGNGLHMPRRLQRRVRQHPYDITIGQGFRRGHYRLCRQVRPVPTHG